jgi:hypothetical protein
MNYKKLGLLKLFRRVLQVPKFEDQHPQNLKT